MSRFIALRYYRSDIETQISSLFNFSVGRAKRSTARLVSDAIVRTTRVRVVGHESSGGSVV